MCFAPSSEPQSDQGNGFGTAELAGSVRWRSGVGNRIFPGTHGGNIALYEVEPDYHHDPLDKGIALAVDPQKQNVMPFQLKRCMVEGSFYASRSPGAPCRIAEITKLELAR